MCSLPLGIQKDLASVDEIVNRDAPLIGYEEMSSSIEGLEDIFDEMEKQHQDSHCKNRDSYNKRDTANTEHRRSLPGYQEAPQSVS
jgi:hypothetical protein